MSKFEDWADIVTTTVVQFANRRGVTVTADVGPQRAEWLCGPKRFVAVPSSNEKVASIRDPDGGTGAWPILGYESAVEDGGRIAAFLFTGP